MKILREFFSGKDKNLVLYLCALLAVGVLLMALSNWRGWPVTFGGGGAGEPEDNTDMSVIETLSGGITQNELFERERELEKRLEEVFSLVEGVGEARVMVSLTPEKETVYATDSNNSETHTRETDSQGGSRETEAKTNQDQPFVITDKTGVDRPLVLREIEPKIAGVIIIAKGGDSIFVKDALTKAACTILGIEANKVQVLKMKGE